MTRLQFKKIAFYYRPDMPKAEYWVNKLGEWLKAHYLGVRILEANIVPRIRTHAPDLVIVLGGDGTICEAVQRFLRWNPMIFGLNLGNVGFLTSVRSPNNFLKGLGELLKGKY